jgi:hypothetical protein
MATVNNVRVNNYNLNLTDSTRAFEAIWELTRAMKKSGWKFKASSNGTTKISNSDPAADNWGSGTVSNAGAAAASIATPVRGRATVTGLTGIVAADKGRFLTITGGATGANNNHHQIEEIVSATSVRIDARNFAVAADANNGALTWTVRDPLGDLYSSFTATLDASIAWWCAQGPSILKIPFTVGSVGNFTVGENIVQTTTGAEGELLGYTYNSVTATGWLSVAPRLRGTGSGVYGWQTGNTITGGESAATVSQNGTALDYVYEVVFTKPAANTTIQIFVGQFETVAESAQLFSFCATQAGATAIVAPGGGGTGNTFGAAAWVMWGTGTTAGTGSKVSGTTTTSVFFLNAQYICVDAIPEQAYTADGSWALFIATTQSLSTAPVGGILYGFQRLNDVEDGELSPYMTINPGGTKTLYTNTRTSAGTITTIAGQTDMCSFAFFDTTLSTTRVCFNGWRGRGMLPVSTDAFTEFEIADLAFLQTAIAFVRATNTVPRMQSSASPYAKPRGLVQLVHTNASNIRMYKGNFKWIYWVNGDQVTDIYGTDPAWVQLSSNLQGSLVLGPSDGTAWFLSQ